MMNPKRVTALCAGLAMMGFGSLGAQDFNTYDTDRDGKVTEQEARNLDRSVRDSFDANKDGVIDRNEFHAALHTWADANRDGRLDRNEMAAFDGWGFDADFGTWDTDRDTFVAKNEFTTGIGNTSIYADWDADRDNRLTTDEFDRAYFRMIDRDRSGSIDQNEYARFDRSRNTQTAATTRTTDRMNTGNQQTDAGMNTGYDGDTLPTTASPLALLALGGLAALGGALGLRKRR